MSKCITPDQNKNDLADHFICYSVHEADGQNVTMQEEIAYALVTSGGKPGQGYPCVLIIDDSSKNKIFRCNHTEHRNISHS